MSDNNALFNSLYPEIKKLTARRKSTWVLTTLPWEDVESIIITRIWEKIHLYNSKQKFENWCNRVITNGLRNILRDNLYKTARPCISSDSWGNGCVFNMGGNSCAKTPSKTQCAECPLFARWQKKKESKFNINTPLSLENHENESKNRINDLLNIDNIKQVIDKQMLENLDDNEITMYKYLYIDNMEPEVVGALMGFKKQRNSDIPGYLIIRKLELKVIQMAKQIIAREGLV